MSTPHDHPATPQDHDPAADPFPTAPSPSDPAPSPSGPADGQPTQEVPRLAEPVAAAPTAVVVRRRIWPVVVGTAAAAALLTSVATAGLTVALIDDRDPRPVTTAATQDTRPISTQGSGQGSIDWQSVAARVAPSVVAIDVSTSSGEGQGSGVIIDAEGHVLTNNHVVAGATDDTVQVTLTDGRIYQARIVGLDPTTDLAVVRIEDAPEDLTPATLGDSDGVEVGAAVMAVGNPLGLANTVTTGIVSAVDRPVTTSQATGSGSAVVTNAIQIDAAINPGNSGGPLFDADGRVIGITSSIATLSSGSSQSGSIGLGFAIPVDLAKSISEQLVQDGTAEHAFLGLGNLTDGTATVEGVTRRGAVVDEVIADSPAERAQLRSGDVVTAIDGKAVGGAEALTAYVRERAAGDRATLTVVRDGSALEIEVVLAARSAEDETGSGSGSQGQQGQQGQDGGRGGDSGQRGQQAPNGAPDLEDFLEEFFGSRG